MHQQKSADKVPLFIKRLLYKIKIARCQYDFHTRFFLFVTFLTFGIQTILGGLLLVTSLLKYAAPFTTNAFFLFILYLFFLCPLYRITLSTPLDGSNYIVLSGERISMKKVRIETAFYLVQSKNAP